MDIKSAILIFSVIFSLFYGETIHGTEKVSPSPIVVRLKTDSKRIPIIITNFIETKSTNERDYYSKLQEVLKFDFEHNGMTNVLPPLSKREILVGFKF